MEVKSKILAQLIVKMALPKNHAIPAIIKCVIVKEMETKRLCRTMEQGSSGEDEAKRRRLGNSGEGNDTQGRAPTGREREGMGNRRMWATLGARETSANGQESKGNNNNNKERKVGKQGTCRQNS